MKPIAILILCATAPIVHAQQEKPDTPAVAEGREEAAKEGLGQVLGKPLRPADKEKITAAVFGPLRQAYAKEKGIEVTEEEIKDFNGRMEALEKEKNTGDAKKREQLLVELKSDKLTPEERTGKEGELKMIEALLVPDKPTSSEKQLVDKGQRELAVESIRAWKTNRELFKQYGGRVIFQQAGPEPLDAYRDFLKEQEKKGAFRINDAAAEKQFWKYFTDDKSHVFLDNAEGKKAFDNPWWQMAKPPSQ